MIAGNCILLTVGILVAHLTNAKSHHIEVNITVPDIKELQIETEDAYVCVSAGLPPHPHKLIGVLPHARQEVVHHILLYGCTSPHLVPKHGETAAWRCDMQPVCNGPSTIFYGWGRNAPDLRLPEGVGYSVGEQTGIRYIVAQVHYLAKRPPDDHSGVTLVLKPHAVPYAAGMLTFASWFEIPPGKKSHKIENSCCFKSHQPLTMFAVRVHTHALGRQVYMNRETWNRSGIETLYTRDPQLPQSFVPSTRHVFWPGDRLTVTCDFDSTNRTTVTSAGSTHNDEMCNMYVMLYGKTPYLTMCDGSETDISSDNPGALPMDAALALDPSPFWTPPRPDGLVPAPAVAAAVAGGGAAKDGKSEEPANAAETEAGAEADAAEDYADAHVDYGLGMVRMVPDPQGALGDATSVTAAPDGSIWVLYRGSGVWQPDTFDGKNRITRSQPVPEAVVTQLDPDNGTVLARWGAGVFYLPHMISTDVLGNVWVVDTGRHQVLKFSPQGQLLMTVGQELTPGSGPERFCKPTQVSVLRDGRFLVADGYCNNRVVLFDKAGKFIAESDPVRAVVHSVLVDECEGLVYAASREAGAVLAMNLEPDNGRLKLVATYDMTANEHGEAWALGFGPFGEQLALMWRQGQDARLVYVRFPEQSWTLPGTSELSPHDFQLGGAPMQLSGAGDRFYAVYLASVGAACDKQCGPIRKFVMVPTGTRLPDASELPSSSHVTDIHPGDAQLLPGGTAVSGQTHHKEDVEKGKGQPGDQVPGGRDEASVNGTAGAAEGEGGAMVADDYDEEVESDVMDAADYEKQVEAKEEDYLGLLSPPPPKKLEKERFEVLVQDKKTVSQNTAINGWAVGLLLVLAALMAVSILHFSKVTLAAYLQEDKESGAPGSGSEGGEVATRTAAAAAAAAGGFPKGSAGGQWSAGLWEGLMSRMRGGEKGFGGRGAPQRTSERSGAGRASSRDVEAARERERLLRG